MLFGATSSVIEVCAGFTVPSALERLPWNGASYMVPWLHSFRDGPLASIVVGSRFLFG